MPDIVTPQFLTASYPGGMVEPSRTYQASWTPALGRYTAAEVTVNHPMVPVKTGDLARSAVRRSIADGIRGELLDANPALASIPAVQTWAKGAPHHARKLGASHVKNPGDLHLQHAALVVRLERIVGGFAVRTLSRCMGIDYPSAKRWMRILRRRGLIT